MATASYIIGKRHSAELVYTRTVGKANSCHVPSGPTGGQFCETGGGGSASSERIVASYPGVAISVDPPSAGEQDAIDAYKDKGYLVINRVLQGENAKDIVGPVAAEAVSVHIAGLSSIMDKSRLDSDATLYRGIKGKGASAIAQLPVGSEFSVPSFQSTSANVKIAAKFANNDRDNGVILKIKVPAGTVALPMDKLSPKISVGEREVLLNKGLRYQVEESKVVRMKISGSNNYIYPNVVTLRIIP